MTQWLDYVSLFGHLQQRKLTQLCNKFDKVGSTICQVRNKLLQIGQRLRKFCQSGEISPNLVTSKQPIT